MWSTETRWFDVTVVTSLFAVGGILLGHFEQHKPRWRRLFKLALFLTIILGLAQTAGRPWAYGFLLLTLIGAAYIHIRWLPNHGINGWTGEPRDKYLALVTRGRKRA